MNANTFLRQRRVWTKLVLVLITVLSGIAGAAPVTKHAACTAAMTFVSVRFPAAPGVAVQTRTAAGGSALTVTRVEPRCDAKGRTLGFVAHLAPRGFVWLRADDELPPLKLYSDTCPFENLPEWAHEAFSAELAEELDLLAAARARGEPVPRNFIPQWRALVDDAGSAPQELAAYGVTALAVGPLLTTAWDQGDPYNLHAPAVSGAPNGYAGRAPIGCGATALAQILRYHKKPAQIARNETYTDSSGACTGTHSADKAGLGAYDWNNMPTTVSASSSTAQKNAVAQLLWHCAVGVHMDFEATGSGSSTSGATSALRNLFGYTCDNYVTRGSYSDANWFAKISTDINAYKPLEYVITSSKGGHMVVCDGVSGTSQIHLNFGWGTFLPGATAWYDMNNIYADGVTWSTQGAIFNITPPASGTVPSVTSFAINNGAASTTSRSVTLNNSCNGSPTHYMASESASFSGASWLTYSTAPSFTLSSGNGTKTVYFKVKNATGESSAVSDTITLNESSGTLPSVTSFAINNGAASTTSRNVTLNNTCSGSPTHYAASENADFSGAYWQPYSTAPSFTLSAGNGTKRVYFIVKNDAGQSSVVSDTIELNESDYPELYVLRMKEKINWVKDGVGSGVIQVAIPTTLTSLGSFLTSYTEIMRYSANGTQWTVCSSGDFIKADKNFTKLVYLTKNGTSFRMTVMRLKGGYLFITRSHGNLLNRDYGYQVTSAGTGGWQQKPVIVRVDFSGVRGQGTYTINYKTKDGLSTTIK